jgi:hypothetical protein
VKTLCSVSTCFLEFRLTPNDSALPSFGICTRETLSDCDGFRPGHFRLMLDGPVAQGVGTEACPGGVIPCEQRTGRARHLRIARVAETTLVDGLTKCFSVW